MRPRPARAWHPQRRRSAVHVGAAGALAIVAILVGCTSGGSGQPDASGSSAPSPSASPATAALAVSTGAADCAVAGDTVLGRGSEAPIALVYGSGPGIVLANELNETLCSMDRAGRELAAAGYRVALIDGDVAKPDALVAEMAVWLRANGTARVGLLGASRGGTFVLAATPQVQPAVTVALSPPQAFRGADALAAMPQITTPVMIVAGSGDGVFAADAARLGAADPDATVVVVPDSPVHGHGLIDADSPVRDQVLDFLKQHLG